MTRTAFNKFAARLQAAHPAPPRPRASDDLKQDEKRRRAIRQLAREFEGLALVEPLPHSWEVHKCNAVWKVITGPNKGAKTFTAINEAGWALTDSHPFGQYPTGKGTAMFVGLRLDALAEIYLGLFEQGLFQVIPDERTKKWRAVRYDRNDPTKLQAYDLAYREKWRDSPPLIPRRWIAGSIGWEDKGKDIPRVINLVNRKRLLWFSAMGRPDQGTHYQLVLFNEEMTSAEFYNEGHRGLMQFAKEDDARRPHGLWPATAQVMNPEFSMLCDKAAADPHSELVRKFEMPIELNPYLSDKGKALFEDGLSDEQVLMRVRGIRPDAWRMCYPEFDPAVHCCQPFDIPPDWTLIFYADPGRRHNCTIIVAVPPGEKHWHVCDGFDIPGGAEQWAEALKELQERRGRKFERGVFDQQMGSERPPGDSNLNVAQQYWNALERAGVQVRVRGPLNGFFPSCNKVDDREVALKSAMHHDEERGVLPQMQIFAGRFPEMEKQIRRARTDEKRVDKRLKNDKVPHDWLDCVEYAAADRPRYSAPVPLEEHKHSPVVEYVLKLRERARRRQQERELASAYHI